MTRSVESFLISLTSHFLLFSFYVLFVWPRAPQPHTDIQHHAVLVTVQDVSPNFAPQKYNILFMYLFIYFRIRNVGSVVAVLTVYNDFPILLAYKLIQTLLSLIICLHSDTHTNAKACTY